MSSRIARIGTRPRGLVVLLERLMRYGGLTLMLVFLARLLDADAFGESSFRSTELLLGLLLVALCILLRLHSTKRRSDPGGDLDQFDRAKIRATEPSGPFSLLPSLELLISTIDHCPRTTERITVHEGHYLHRFVREFVIPDAQARDLSNLASVDPPLQTCYLPLLRLSRGQIIDNLTVTDALGGQVSPLNTSEGRGVAATMLRKYTRLVVGRAEYQSRFHALLKALERALETDGRLTRARAIEADDARIAAATTQLVEALESMPIPVFAASRYDAWDRHRQRLKQVIEALASDYVIFIRTCARPGERVVINYSYSRPPTPESLKPRDWWRYWFGLRPHEHAFDVGGCDETQSLHFIFEAPSEQYVHSCQTELMLAPDDAVKRDGILIAPREDEGALHYAHIYVRRDRDTLAGSRVGSVIAQVNCWEKPPGLLGLVALVAFAQALLIWTVGIFIDDLFLNQQPLLAGLFGLSGDNQELPAILLALPGLLAGWLAAQFSSERLRQTSFATVGGIVSLGLLAIATTTIALAKSARDALQPGFGADHPVWAGLMLISAGLAVDLTARFCARTWTFAQRMKRGAGLVRRPV